MLTFACYKINISAFFSVFRYHNSKEKVKNFNVKNYFISVSLLYPVALLVVSERLGGGGGGGTINLNLTQITNMADAEVNQGMTKLLRILFVE